jgi:inhibitor of KinA
MQITPLGDSALVVHVCAGFEHDAARCLAAVTKARARLHAARLPGVIEITPAFTTVGVFFDPLAVDNLESSIVEALRGRSTNVPTPNRNIEVPVCYEEEFAPDLAEVATRSQLTPEAVVSRHVRATYRVSCVGFTPGFPYLSGLPNELATPRKATPRKIVVAGSVAIGGKQTGIYSQESPGGWNIIGRTPLRLFDPSAMPPALFAIGDAVRFCQITRAEFGQMSR